MKLALSILLGVIGGCVVVIFIAPVFIVFMFWLADKSDAFWDFVFEHLKRKKGENK